MKQPCFLGVPLTFAGWVPQSPFASRRVPTVWNGQGQKFGQKATSFDFATRAMYQYRGSMRRSQGKLGNHEMEVKCWDLRVRGWRLAYLPSKSPTQWE
jgi:hypothetical protein